MKKEVLREVLWSLSRRRKSKTRLFHMDDDVDRDQKADDDDDSSSLSWHCQEHLRAKGWQNAVCFSSAGWKRILAASASTTTRGGDAKRRTARVLDACERLLLNADFVEEEEEEEEEDDDGTPRLFVPSIPSTRRLANDDDDGGMTGPFVWQIMDARDVSRGKSTAATTTTKEAPRERRMLKVTMTDGYSRVIVLERMRWSNVDQAPERWERQLMPGTKVLVRDLKQSTTMRSGRMDEDLVVFADDERNFEILGGRVDKLKEKFEKTMRMKAASRFADDGFSLGDVCEAPKFQPFDDEAWKRLEKERKVKEEEERKEKEETERKEKMERRERERAARKELAREQRQQLAGESLEDYDYNDGDEKEDEMEPMRVKPKLPPKKKGAAAVAPATPSSPSVAASNQRKQQHRSKPTLPGNKRGATNKEENSDVLLETQKRQEQQRHEQQAKKERSKILEKLTRPPPRRVLDDASRDGGRGVGRGVGGGRGRDRTAADDSSDTHTLTLDQLRAKKLADRLDRERFTAPLGKVKASSSLGVETAAAAAAAARGNDQTQKKTPRGVPESSNTKKSRQSSSSSSNAAAGVVAQHLFQFSRPPTTTTTHRRREDFEREK